MNTLRPQPVPVDGTCTTGPVTSWADSGYTTVINTRAPKSDPKWREKVRAQQNATNPYSYVYFPVNVDKTTLSPVDWRWGNLTLAFNPTRWVSVETRVQGYVHYWYIKSPVGTDDAYASDSLNDSRAKLAFLSKIKQAQAEFNAPVFLGELKESIEMLRHPLRGFTKATHRYNARMRRLEATRRRALRHIARRKLTKDIRRAQVLEVANRAQRAMENAFLQWTYGISPLINDVKALVNLPVLMGEAHEVKRLSVTMPRTWKIGSFTETTHWNSYGFARAVTVRENYATSSSQFRGALRVKITPPNTISRLKELSMFNLSEFVPTLYELLPFSFVADYFSSLGDVINGAFTSTSDLVYCSHTWKLTVKNTAVMTPIPGTPRPVYWPLIGATATHEARRFKRVNANLSVNLRDLRFEMPDLRQLINTAVLSASLLRRGVFHDV